MRRAIAAAISLSRAIALRSSLSLDAAAPIRARWSGVAGLGVTTDSSRMIAAGQQRRAPPRQHHAREVVQVEAFDESPRRSRSAPHLNSVDSGLLRALGPRSAP